MTKATWNGALIAESDDTVVVEGNHYFPRDAVDASLLRDSASTTVCPWKGTAHYYSLVVATAPRTRTRPGTIPTPSRRRRDQRPGRLLEGRRSRLGQEKTRIAIGVETVVLGDGVGVGRFHRLEAS